MARLQNDALPLLFDQTWGHVHWLHRFRQATLVDFLAWPANAKLEHLLFNVSSFVLPAWLVNSLVLKNTVTNLLPRQPRPLAFPTQADWNKANLT
jgi:hypothetical protein